MRSVNPLVIPRNHKVEEALKAEAKKFKAYYSTIEILERSLYSTKKYY